MVNPMVERATSHMLIGPDWAMNIEICDVCNKDPAQAKEVVKGIKKRLRSKNAKVQLLALTLLETIVKNCGDIVHMHVAEKELPHQMVKMAKKKPDFHVKEKILTLIDTWQEAFGGPRARYPQYFVAYQDLLHLGAVFPKRSETSAPIFTPPQTHPLTSYPQNLRNPESRPAAAESSAEAEFPTLSLTEIQNARGIMDVLAEMLNALDPGNKEGIKQDVIVDLVEQCRAYKHRVVHLVNSTTDESLLSQGLALNDDLQRVLAKHESISSGATSVQLEKAKPEIAEPLVNVDAPLIDTGDKQSDKGSTSSTNTGTQLSLPAPPATNGQLTTATKIDPMIDLLSGDGFNSPTTNTLALVPVGEPQPASPVASQHNALTPVDMFSQSNNYQSSNSTAQGYPTSPHFQQQTNVQALEPSLHTNGSVSGPMLPQYEQSLHLKGSASAWNGQIAQQQQPASPVYGAEASSAFPPPPWEAQLDETQSAIGQPQQLQGTQVVVSQSQPSPSGTYLHGSQTMNNNQPFGMYNQAVPSNQMGMYPQPLQSGQMGYIYPQQMYANQMASYGYGFGYGQGHQQNPQFLEQSMSGLSIRDDSALRNSSSSVPSFIPSGKPTKPEDRLFGDLVDISKFKPAKTTPGRAGSM